MSDSEKTTILLVKQEPGRILKISFMEGGSIYV